MPLFTFETGKDNKEHCNGKKGQKRVDVPFLEGYHALSTSVYHMLNVFGKISALIMTDEFCSCLNANNHP